MRYNAKPVQYVYIRQNSNGYLLHGVTASDSRAIASIPIWKPPRSFDWARRFSSVDNAIKCATDNHITGVSVIDRAGRVLHTIAKETEVRRRG